MLGKERALPFRRRWRVADCARAAPVFVIYAIAAAASWLMRLLLPLYRRGRDARVAPSDQVWTRTLLNKEPRAHRGSHGGRACCTRPCALTPAPRRSTPLRAHGEASDTRMPRARCDTRARRRPALSAALNMRAERNANAQVRKTRHHVHHHSPRRRSLRRPRRRLRCRSRDTGCLCAPRYAAATRLARRAAPCPRGAPCPPLRRPSRSDFRTPPPVRAGPLRLLRRRSRATPRAPRPWLPLWSARPRARRLLASLWRWRRSTKTPQR
jgi:hypothetical protein